MIKNPLDSRPLRKVIPIIPVVGALCLSGCGETTSIPSHDTATTTTAPAPEAHQHDHGTTPRTVGMLTITLWDRNGGYPEINVYPGPHDTVDDRKAHKRYFETGDVVGVECLVRDGRTVTADVNATNPQGEFDPEEEGSSRVWYKLATENPTYATAVYAKIDPAVAEQLEEC